MPNRRDSFFDDADRRRPAGDYEDNYGAGAVEGGFRDRVEQRRSDQRQSDQRQGYSHGVGSGQGGPLPAGVDRARARPPSGAPNRDSAHEFDGFLGGASGAQETESDAAARRFVEGRLREHDQRYQQWRRQEEQRLRRIYHRKQA